VDAGPAACPEHSCSAQAFVRTVNDAGWCGARDWRLPGREELRSLVDYGIPYPGPTINMHYFPHTRSQFYWAAEANAAAVDEAWGIGFAFGFDYAYYTTDRVRVRLVRGASSKGTAQAYTQGLRPMPDQSDREPYEGLIWARCSVGMRWNGSRCQGEAEALSWVEAQAQVKDGWRIPSLKELSRLVELNRFLPAIDSRRFPATPPADFWTTTPFINTPGMTWRVNFREGEAHGVKNKVPAFLRLVYDPASRP
jgi:hypothetical protein